MKKIQRLSLITIFSLILFVGLVAQANPIDRVVEKSDALESFQAKIAMTKFRKSKKSKIILKFLFISPDMMRIDYLSPDRLRGQLIIVNQKKFYSYIPSLNREITKTVEKGENQAGKEMGFFFRFVDQTTSDFLKNYKLQENSGPMTAEYEIEDFKQSYKVYEAVFIKGNKKQIVEISANSHVPVGVQIFDDGAKVISLKVLSFDYNKGIAKDKFKIPPD